MKINIDLTYDELIKIKVALTFFIEDDRYKKEPIKRYINLLKKLDTYKFN